MCICDSWKKRREMTIEDEDDRRGDSWENIRFRYGERI